jgi:hypothetical protein
VALAGSSMVPLEGTIVDVSLPHVGGSSSSRVEETTWALISYPDVFRLRMFLFLLKKPTSQIESEEGDGGLASNVAVAGAP